MHVHLFICIEINIHLYTRINIHSIHTQTCTHIHMCVHVCVHAYVHMGVERPGSTGRGKRGWRRNGGGGGNSWVKRGDGTLLACCSWWVMHLGVNRAHDPCLRGPVTVHACFRFQILACRVSAFEFRVEGPLSKSPIDDVWAYCGWLTWLGYSPRPPAALCR